MRFRYEVLNLVLDPSYGLIVASVLVDSVCEVSVFQYWIGIVVIIERC